MLSDVVRQIANFDSDGSIRIIRAKNGEISTEFGSAFKRDIQKLKLDASIFSGSLAADSIQYLETLTSNTAGALESAGHADMAIDVMSNLCGPPNMNCSVRVKINYAALLLRHDHACEARDVLQNLDNAGGLKDLAEQLSVEAKKNCA